jgi:hypothetical protein
VTQERLTLDELLDELRVALVSQHSRWRRRVAYTLAIFAAGVAATVALGATYGQWLSSYRQDVDFAQCMRSNGVPSYRDPSSNKGPLSATQIDPNSPTFLSAAKTCQQYAPSGHAGPPAPTVAQLRAAVGFTQCIRVHGFPRFPDPLATAPDQPNFSLGTGENFPLNSTTNFQTPSPAFRRAAKTCGVRLPSGP